MVHPQLMFACEVLTRVLNMMKDCFDSRFRCFIQSSEAFYSGRPAVMERREKSTLTIITSAAVSLERFWQLHVVIEPTFATRREKTTFDGGKVRAHPKQVSEQAGQVLLKTYAS